MQKYTNMLEVSHFTQVKQHFGIFFEISLNLDRYKNIFLYKIDVSGYIDIRLMPKNRRGRPFICLNVLPFDTEGPV